MKRIDVHHHFLSDEYMAAWGEEKFNSISAAGSVARWSVDLSLDLMEASNTAISLLSVSSPGWPPGSPQQVRNLARACNVPFARKERIELAVKGYAEVGLSDAELRGIERHNAMTLFPRLQGSCRMSEPEVENLETLWERLAQGIDRAGRENEVLFLSKLSLLLGDALQDIPKVEQIIETALQDLS